MSQPDADRFHISKLVRPALDPTILAISNREGQTAAENNTRFFQTEALMLSFRPRDSLDLTLIGQLVGFNEVFADTVHDVLASNKSADKQRTLSSLVAMGRLTQQHVKMLEKRDLEPWRTEIEAQPKAVKPPAPKPQPAVAATPEPPPKPEQVPEPIEQPKEEISWVDQPYTEWVIATPAEIARQAALAGVRVDQPNADWVIATPAEIARQAALAKPPDQDNTVKPRSRHRQPANSPELEDIAAE